MNTEIINLQYTTIKDPLPDFIYDGLGEYSRTANAYHPQPSELIGKLAQKFTIPKEMIYLVSGADEAIQMFALSFGANAFVFTPTYVVYGDVEEYGGRLTRIFSLVRDAFVISTDRIPDASLIYLANPNNPCGFTTKDKVLELVENNPQAVVVIDEAYGEFADLSVIHETEKYPNMAVIRSFSKSYGMAGNRIGFFVASPGIVTKVKNKAQWSNISYLSVGAAQIALDHEKYFADMRQNIENRRDDFFLFLNKQGYFVFSSKINAILLKFVSQEDAWNFVKYLHDRAVIVSFGNGNSNMGLDESYVRISIGNEKQMEAAKRIISEFPRN